MKEYRTITKIAGPLVFVEKTEPIGYGELVNIVLCDGTIKRGQVLDTSDDLVVVQVFETTAGIGRDSGVRFTGETIKMPVGKEMLGRILSGGGKPIDGGPEIVPEKRLDITGAAINPYARASPSGFHPDRYLDHRRDKHACPGPETPDLLGCRSSPQQHCTPDRPAGKGARLNREPLPWFSLQWVSPRKRQTTSCRTSSAPVRLSVQWSSSTLRMTRLSSVSSPRVLP